MKKQRVFSGQNSISVKLNVKLIIDYNILIASICIEECISIKSANLKNIFAKTDGSLMKVEVIISLENQFLVFFLSGFLRQVLL